MLAWVAAKAAIEGVKIVMPWTVLSVLRLPAEERMLWREVRECPSSAETRLPGRLMMASPTCTVRFPTPVEMTMVTLMLEAHV